jgi:hypothetical protein
MRLKSWVPPTFLADRQFFKRRFELGIGRSVLKCNQTNGSFLPLAASKSAAFARGQATFRHKPSERN